MSHLPLLNILLVDDEEIAHQSIGDYLRDTGYRVEGAYDGMAALRVLAQEEFDLALVDVRMPGMDGLSLLERLQEEHPELSVVIVTGHGTMETAVQALRLGAADFLTKPVDLLMLDAVVEKVVRLRDLRREQRHLRDAIGGIQTSEAQREQNRHFVGASPATHRVHVQIREAVEAGVDTILVTGETGTGKEVVAREIHFQAGREESPFIAVSCPALPETLVESQLFGHVKGAFTGAVADRAGYFERADGGTLFLDEVADLTPATQARLLRVLETRAFERVGGSKEITVDLRLIAATNRPLEELVDAGQFRRDLYYRLNVYTIDLLPLRQRRQDILPLAEHFLELHGARRGLNPPGFAADAREALQAYDFPGNARELRNLVERAAILCKGEPLQARHFSLPVSSNGEQPSSAGLDEEKERSRILQALEDARWNRRQAARALGMTYDTLRYRMQKLRID